MVYEVDHINRHVSDVDNFVEFYTAALEYELLDRGVKANGCQYAILKGCGHELFVSEKEGFAANNGNCRHIGYHVDNVDELLVKLKEKGYAAKNQEIIVKTYTRQFYIKDPDGFEIDLIQWTDKQGFHRNLADKNK